MIHVRSMRAPKGKVVVPHVQNMNQSQFNVRRVCLFSSFTRVKFTFAAVVAGNAKISVVVVFPCSKCPFKQCMPRMAYGWSKAILASPKNTPFTAVWLKVYTTFGQKLSN